MSDRRYEPSPELRKSFAAIALIAKGINDTFGRKYEEPVVHPLRPRVTDLRGVPRRRSVRE